MEIAVPQNVYILEQRRRILSFFRKMPNPFEQMIRRFLLPVRVNLVRAKFAQFTSFS